MSPRITPTSYHRHPTASWIKCCCWWWWWWWWWRWRWRGGRHGSATVRRDAVNVHFSVSVATSSRSPNSANLCPQGAPRPKKFGRAKEAVKFPKRSSLNDRSKTKKWTKNEWLMGCDGQLAAEGNCPRGGQAGDFLEKCLRGTVWGMSRCPCSITRL